MAFAKLWAFCPKAPWLCHLSGGGHCGVMEVGMEVAQPLEDGVQCWCSQLGGGTHRRPEAPHMVLAQTSPHLPPKHICSSVPSALGGSGW